MKRSRLSFGPPLGVRNTVEPYDDASLGDYCQDAENVFFRDPSLLSGAQGRPGFNQPSASALSASGQSQGIHLHVTATGTAINLLFIGGSVYALQDDQTTLIDVTPSGITIDTAARVGVVSISNVIVVTDGVNTPWVGSALSATSAMTGTKIPINAAGDDWTAYGPPTIYQGSVFFIAKTVPIGSAIQPGVGMVWCEPNQPLVGYTQSGYADFWNIIEQGGPRGNAPLSALWGTNSGLYYFRAIGIGVAVGTPSLSFSTTATRDSVSADIGCVAPWSLDQYGNTMFFADTYGRAMMLPIGGAPVAIWKQLAALQDSALSYGLLQSVLAENCSGCIVPELNLYALAVFSGGEYRVSTAGAYRVTTTGVYRIANVSLPTELEMFDATSGNYAGRWTTTLTNETNPPQFRVLGITASATSDRLFSILANTQANGPFFLALHRLSDNVWEDGTPPSETVVPAVSVTTNRLGYAAGTLYDAANTADIITMSTAPLAVTVTTPAASDVIETSGQAPNASSDGTYRTVVGMDVHAARGILLVVSPLTADEQWGFQRLEFDVTTSRAGPEDA